MTSNDSEKLIGLDLIINYKKVLPQSKSNFLTETIDNTMLTISQKIFSNFDKYNIDSFLADYAELSKIYINLWYPEIKNEELLELLTNYTSQQMAKSSQRNCCAFHESMDNNGLHREINRNVNQALRGPPEAPR
jgi:hypothetical protein